MAVTVTALAVLFAILYLRTLKTNYLREGAFIGGVWFLVNVVIDLFLFLPPSPMQMSLGAYMTDIGLTYLTYPIVTIGFGYILEHKSMSNQ
jgi:hypothetical protein